MNLPEPIVDISTRVAPAVDAANVNTSSVAAAAVSLVGMGMFIITVSIASSRADLILRAVGIILGLLLIGAGVNFGFGAFKPATDPGQDIITTVTFHPSVVLASVKGGECERLDQIVCTYRSSAEQETPVVYAYEGLELVPQITTITNGEVAK